MGHIFQINVSQGGVPKVPVRLVEVQTDGITTDKQKNRRHHGGPNKALCLYSLEHILALQEEGHPIYAGATGENLTVSGVDWEKMAVGSRWSIGREVVIEITSFAVPCKNIRASFVDEVFTRISQKTHPGWARVYGKVLQEGAISVGDVVKAAE